MIPTPKEKDAIVTVQALLARTVQECVTEKTEALYQLKEVVQDTIDNQNLDVTDVCAIRQVFRQLEKKDTQVHKCRTVSDVLVVFFGR